MAWSAHSSGREFGAVGVCVCACARARQQQGIGLLCNARPHHSQRALPLAPGVSGHRDAVCCVKSTSCLGATVHIVCWRLQSKVRLVCCVVLVISGWPADPWWHAHVWHGHSASQVRYSAAHCTIPTAQRCYRMCGHAEPGVGSGLCVGKHALLCGKSSFAHAVHDAVCLCHCERNGCRTALPHVLSAAPSRP